MSLTGRRRSRLVFLAAIAGFALVGLEVAEHDLVDALAAIVMAVLVVVAAMAEWPELDRLWRAQRSDHSAVDRLETFAVDEAPTIVRPT